MSIAKKGIQKERELANKLYDMGFMTMRAAASGSVDRPCPDIIAAKNGDKYAIECKSSSSNVIYINWREIKELIRFSIPFRMTPIIAVRFIRQSWKFYMPHELEMTPDGNLRIDK